MKNIFISIVILYIFKHTISQYDASYNEMQQGYQYPYQNLQYQHYHQAFQNRRWKDNEDYNEYDENNCDCDKCEELKPGCLSVCPNCLLPPQSMIPPNYVFLPIPYPYPMTPKEDVVTETTERTTTTILTTTSPTTTTETEAEATTVTTTEATETTITEAPTESARTEEPMTISPFHVKPKNPYIITSLRKTKPHWIPKYGIVPISDTFAEKLMLQLRNMKVLHNRKEYSRNIDKTSQLK